MIRSKFVIGILAVLVSTCAAIAAPPSGPAASDPPGRDSILDWNAVALAAVATDFSNTYGAPDQPGPTHTSRALAIVHLAMFDAANTITPTASPYLPSHKPTKLKVVSLDAAVARAAATTLAVLYPRQAAVFADALSQYLIPITNDTARNNGISIGQGVAIDILTDRLNDGSDIVGSYTPTGLPGNHNVDPLNPNQGFLTPAWGHVKPFTNGAVLNFDPLPPPPLGSDAYADAFNDVKSLGGDGVITATKRTAEQTEIGIFWAYDGSPQIGVPPRLYNQAVRTIAIQQKNCETQNARLFALVNAAMADAGVCCWATKYHYAFWRPILGVRHADVDGNIATVADSNWTPLDSPASNRIGKNFTPNFPSYASGHATFGSATFRILQHFYGRDHLQFTLVSDELNGVTTDSAGNLRPLRPRTFRYLSDAAYENARSRIYLGIHWQFDADEGLRTGVTIADETFHHLLKLN